MAEGTCSAAQWQREPFQQHKGRGNLFSNTRAERTCSVKQEQREPVQQKKDRGNLRPTQLHLNIENLFISTSIEGTFSEASTRTEDLSSDTEPVQSTGTKETCSAAQG
jgi:hypothetical protein